jgi:AmmeMemoRadiSam system protein B
VTRAIREPAVAGQFYPGDRAELQSTVEDLLRDALTRPNRAAGRIAKAIICPHAGYQYSGPIAASAYAALMPATAPVHLVVIAGPSHFHHVHGVAVPSVDAFDIPLGAVAVDDRARARVIEIAGVVVDDHAHAQEQSLEVQLPFVKIVFGDVPVLPLAVGRAGAAVLAELLEMLWGDAGTRVVISTDLSHQIPAPLARQLDARTAESICRLEPPAYEMACGAAAVAGMLTAAREHHLDVELLDLRNSADTAGDANRVVGYGAFAMFEPALTST